MMAAKKADPATTEAEKPAAKKAAPKKTAAPKAAAADGAKRTDGIHKPVQPSKELGDIVGNDPLARGEVVSKMWEYIKKHDLQDPKDKRQINAGAPPRNGGLVECRAGRVPGRQRQPVSSDPSFSTLAPSSCSIR